MKLTNEQINRVTKDWTEIAGEEIKTENINGTIYGYGSELGCLRLANTYQYSKNTRAAYSENLQTWFFALDMAGV